jgi:hypothetical protein
VLVLDIIEILPPLGKYKYDTRRMLPVKCYIDNFVHMRSCISNVNTPQMQPNALNDPQIALNAKTHVWRNVYWHASSGICIGPTKT